MNKPNEKQESIHVIKIDKSQIEEILEEFAFVRLQENFGDKTANFSCVQGDLDDFTDYLNDQGFEWELV